MSMLFRWIMDLETNKHRNNNAITGAMRLALNERSPQPDVCPKSFFVVVIMSRACKKPFAIYIILVMLLSIEFNNFISPHKFPLTCIEKTFCI